ncbi:HNH endonuclease [Vibrio vulnificus]
MKTETNEFLNLQGYPIFERIKPLVRLLDVKYVRWWSKENITTAEIHIVHPEVKHITIGTGSHYSGRTRVAICLKDTTFFESLYGKLSRKNSTTYVRFDDDGFEMIRHIAGDWEHELSKSDVEFVELVNSAINLNSLDEYEKTAMVKQRIGHSRFAKQVKARAGNVCQINGDISRNLIASHIKPWSSAQDYEKVDLNNGLCLSPNYDGLFEVGLIGFNDDGSIILNGLSESELRAYSLDGTECISVKTGQSKYLAWHRKYKVFKK